MSLLHFVCEKCFLLLLYVMDVSGLEQLGEQLETKQKLIAELQDGVKATEDLLEKLQASLKTADDKIAGLASRISDNSVVQTTTAQLQEKNAQLQGLVQKFGTAITK